MTKNNGIDKIGLIFIGFLWFVCACLLWYKVLSPTLAYVLGVFLLLLSLPLMSIRNIFDAVFFVLWVLWFFVYPFAYLVFPPVPIGNFIVENPTIVSVMTFYLMLLGVGFIIKGFLAK